MCLFFLFNIDFDSSNQILFCFLTFFVPEIQIEPKNSINRPNRKLALFFWKFFKIQNNEVQIKNSLEHKRIRL
jgi:hypothetical protein